MQGFEDLTHLLSGLEFYRTSSPITFTNDTELQIKLNLIRVYELCELMGVAGREPGHFVPLCSNRRPDPQALCTRLAMLRLRRW